MKDFSVLIAVSTNFVICSRGLFHPRKLVVVTPDGVSYTIIRTEMSTEMVFERQK